MAVLAVVFGLTLSGPALAAGNGNGSGKASGQADGQANAGASTDAKASAGGSDKSNGKGSDQSNGKGSDHSSKGSDTKAGGSSTASDHQTSGTAGTSGTATEAQPLSNADQNSGGANGKCPGGPYCSTRDGSASANGNGGGKSTGKPCAACVGKADNKNPKGQYPGPQDRNNGYECDGNHGIARGNPAHTGCTTSPPTTQTCVPGPGEHVDENGNCVKNGNQQCVPKDDEVLVNGQCVKKSDQPCVPGPGQIVDANGACVTIGGEEECVPGAGEMKQGDECVPVCPTDSTKPMDDEDCVPAGTENEGPGVNRPQVVAGVEAFAPRPQAGVQPPAGVQQYAGPSGSAATPAGVLPMTGAGALMNTLAAAGLGLLVLGAATLARRRTARG